MAGRVRYEIKQTRALSNLEQEAMLSLRRTAAVLDHAMAEALRPHGVTSTQYNVLRILRGAGPEGLSRNAVRDRLVAPVPDATRLLDRMVDLGLVSRDRDVPDRRYVTARITKAGLDLLARLEAPINQLHSALLGHLGERKLRDLIDLLDDAQPKRSGR